MISLCPYCGAASRRNCELAEMSGMPEGTVECLWEIDPDIQREERDERKRIEKDFPHD